MIRRPSFCEGWGRGTLFEALGALEIACTSFLTRDLGCDPQLGDMPHFDMCIYIYVYVYVYVYVHTYICMTEECAEHVVGCSTATCPKTVCCARPAALRSQMTYRQQWSLGPTTSGCFLK